MSNSFTLPPNCVKYGTCIECAGVEGSYCRGSEPLLATDICLRCNNKRSEDTLIETKDNRELQEMDYVCKFYRQRKD